MFFLSDNRAIRAPQARTSSSMWGATITVVPKKYSAGSTALRSLSSLAADVPEFGRDGIKPLQTTAKAAQPSIRTWCADDYRGNPQRERNPGVKPGKALGSVLSGTSINPPRQGAAVREARPLKS
jgi:hypothetical protein